jgi:dTDP-4-amino-4,6-dideoxygalactose transaminase
MATHVYGNPCDVERLAAIAARRGLAVIYDAAHAFGVRWRGQSILAWGDLSMVSLHATKLFHTAEGGLVTGSNGAALARVEWMRRFGHNGPEAFHGWGTNAKMTELQAALGLCLVGRIGDLIGRRRHVSAVYDRILFDRPCGLGRPRIREGTEYNYAYYPVIFADEAALLSARARLEREGIFCRRYFYPSLERLFCDDSEAWDVPVSRDVAARILCLPLAATMEDAQAERVAGAVRRARAS